MEIRRLISDILEGETRVLTFDNVIPGPDKDFAANVLYALNFVRLTFGAERSTPIVSQILSLLCSGTMVENAFAIYHEWPNGIHAEVEDVYHIPLFEMSLKHVSTNYDSPSPDHIAVLLENLCTCSSSAAIVMTRLPDVAVCLRLHASAQDIFVLLNQRPASEHNQPISLTFSTSLRETIKRLRDIFPLQKAHVSHGNFGWQARLLEKCTGHIFVPRAADDSRLMEDSLVMSSLLLLTSKAELEGLKRENSDLRRKRQRLDKSVADLQAQCREEKTKTQSYERTMVNATSINLGRNPPAVHSLRHVREQREGFHDKDEMDPSIGLARRLQAMFNSENEFLLKERRELTRTAQRRYHCGVCLDDVPEDDIIHIDTCGHEICRDCTRGHVCAKIEEHRFPVLCPVCMTNSGNKNPGTIAGPLVQLLGISEKQWETWVEMEIARFSIPISCQKCHHSGFVDRQDLQANSEIHCPFPRCNHVWCKQCQRTIDQGGPKHSCDGTSELDHLMKQKGWRYCPNCKTPIQKTQGCNHLSCIAPNCNTNFCYGCGKVMRISTADGRNTEEFCTC